jgi:tetratricopeptide (TPR) repeat protein
MAITRTGKAKELFEKAVELSTYPNKENDKAIELFTEVIKLLPNDDESYAGRASCYTSIGELDKSVEDKSKAIALNPTEPKYYANRRYNYAWLGEIEKAVADAEKEIELSGKEQAARVYCALAMDIEQATGDTDQALVYYKKSADHGGFMDYTKEALARLGK